MNVRQSFVVITWIIAINVKLLRLRKSHEFVFEIGVITKFKNLIFK